MQKRRSNKILLDPPVRPDVRPITGLKMQGNRIVGLDRPVKPFKFFPFCEWCQCNHPYNEHTKKLPELDAEGHPIPEW